MRARRFAIEMAVHLRRRGEQSWQTGWTENISRSGVLLRVQEVMERETEIEMSFSLPLQFFGRPLARVLCRGSVVRTVPATDAVTASALAATITRYRFLRPREQVMRL